MTEAVGTIGTIAGAAMTVEIIALIAREVGTATIATTVIASVTRDVMIAIGMIVTNVAIVIDMSDVTMTALPRARMEAVPRDVIIGRAQILFSRNCAS